MMNEADQHERGKWKKSFADKGLLAKTNAAGKTVWLVRVFHNGKQERFGSYPTKSEARAFYIKIKNAQREGRFFPEHYQRGGYVLAEDVIVSHVQRATVKNLFALKNYGRWWTARLKGKRLNAITPALLDDAQHDLLATGFAPQTVRHYMQFLRHILHKAVRDGKLERNPFAQITLPKIGNGKTRFLSAEEEGALLEKLGPRYESWARLAILTGLRLSEQFSMKWADVDFDRGVVTLPKTKAGHVQYAVLNDEAKSVLRELQIRQMNHGGCGVWVFPSENPRTHLDQRNFYYRVFVPVVEALHLEGVTWHTFRHTFASRLAMSGEGEGTIAALLRHSTNALVRRYAHLSPSHLKAAAEHVANFGKTSPASVTKTVTEGKSNGEETAEVVERFGAGDGI